MEEWGADTAECQVSAEPDERGGAEREGASPSFFTLPTLI